MKKQFTYMFFASMLTLVSCGESKTGENGGKPNESDTSEVKQSVDSTKEGVYLTPFTESIDYPNASLKIKSPGSDENAGIFTDADGKDLFIEPGDFNIEFEVKDFELMTPTPGDSSKGIAYSGKGQHIHFILDNGPYSAKYKPVAEFTEESPIEAGNHVMLAFLARSWHESVKNENSFVVRKFTVGEAEEKSDFDVFGSHMFYSRPKGTYSKAKGQTDKILLDFFLVNTQIKEEGNFVEVSVDGKMLQKITNWQPYLINGLELGKHVVKLELKDADGNLIEGPYNSVEREFEMTE